MFVLVFLLLLSVENGHDEEVLTCEQIDLRSLLGLVNTFSIETKDKLRHVKETVTSANSTVSKDLKETNRRIDIVNATLNFIKNALVNIRHILEVDECHSNPCINGASCVDGINSYSCRCITGYNGTNCQININECAISPCKNNATCHDQINGYTCTCSDGWTGAYCQEAIHQSVYHGTSFITGFMEGHGDPTLLIACPELTAIINVSIPALGIINEQHQLTNGALTLTYPDTISSTKSGTISNNAVYITANRPIVLFAGRLTNDFSADGSLVKPESSLGSDYILSGFPFKGIGTEEYLIASKVNQTIITIFTNSLTENVTLNRMETYMRVGTNITGTMISSSAPVFVLSGHRCANIPYGSAIGGCDYIDEEMPSLSSLGTRHVVSFMAHRPDFTISIDVPYDNTSITIYNAAEAVVETITSMMKTAAILRSYTGFQSISIISTQPVLVTQYGHGQGLGEIGDPSMMTIPDVSHFGNLYDFVVPRNFTSTVAIVMNSSYSITDLLLDGVAFSPTQTINVTITGYGKYVVLYGDVLPGYHRLVHTAGNSVSFGAWIYGRRNYAEYAWSLGQI